MVRIKSTAGPWCLVVDCLGEIFRQVLGNALPRTTGPVDGRNWLRTDSRMALPWRGVIVCLSAARPRKWRTSSREALPPHAVDAPPPAKGHRAGRSSTARRKADALLAMPREPPGLLLCLPSLGSWPLRLGETALRCSSSLALCKHDRCLFQNHRKPQPCNLARGSASKLQQEGGKIWSV